MFDRKHLFAMLALALLPAAAIADDFDDLDVTMEVLDSESELDVLVKQMRGPRHGDDVDRDLGYEDEVPGESESPFANDEFTIDDDFDRDNVFRKEPLTEEDWFESREGEDLDLDLPTDDPNAYPSN